MKRLLICTIMRNQQANVGRWFRQLVGPNSLRAALRDAYDITLSVYENDSTDGTDTYVQQALPTLASDYKVSLYATAEKLGTQQYGSVWSIDRIRNLAAARNRCLEQAGDLSRFDKIAYIEPDVTYDPAWCSELVLARHPAAAGLPEPDVYSGWSLRSAAHPKESVFLYDTCATRATSADVCWDVGESCGQWRGRSLVPTGLPGYEANCLHRVWSTFNCFCVYNAKPFAQGLRWGFINRRVDPSGIRWEDGDHGSGWLDADTAVLCEDLRARGYNGVYLNTNCLVRHA